jgi:hypothetical protein
MLIFGDKNENKTYSGDALHDEDERVAGQVARVAERVLLPDLGEWVLVASQGGVVDAEVALEEEVDKSTHDEPEEGELVAETLDGRMALGVGERDSAKGDGTEGGEEQGEGVLHGVGVGDIVIKHQIQRVVGMGSACCGHGVI